MYLSNLTWIPIKLIFNSDESIVISKGILSPYLYEFDLEVIYTAIFPG